MTMPRFPRHAHVYVDESKTHGYILAATAVPPSKVRDIDRALRKLTRPGQTRVHFTSESAPSRRALLSRLVELDVTVQLYVIRNQPDKIARPMALRLLVDDLCEASASRLIIERDESLERADRRIIHEALAKNGDVDAIDYLHSPPTEHPLLWVSDAAAWCYQAGGDWMRRATPLIDGVQELR